MDLIENESIGSRGVAEIADEFPDGLDVVILGLLLHLGRVQYHEAQDVAEVEVGDGPEHFLVVFTGGAGLPWIPYISHFSII